MLTRSDSDDDSGGELTRCGDAQHVAQIDGNLSRRLELEKIARTADVKVLVDSNSGVTGLSESSHHPLRT